MLQAAYAPDPADRISDDVAAIAAARMTRSPSSQGEERTLDSLIDGGFTVTVVGFPDPTRHECERHYSVILEMTGLKSPAKVTLHGTGPSLDDAVRNAMSIGERLHAIATLPAVNPFASGCRAPTIRMVSPEIVR